MLCPPSSPAGYSLSTMTFNVRLELPALNIPGIGKVVRSPTNSKQGPVLGFILSLLKPQLELEMIGAFCLPCSSSPSSISVSC